jgi:hypothetical protein
VQGVGGTISNDSSVSSSEIEVSAGLRSRKVHVLSPAERQEAINSGLGFSNK